MMWLPRPMYSQGVPVPILKRLDCRSDLKDRIADGRYPTSP